MYQFPPFESTTSFPKLVISSHSYCLESCFLLCVYSQLTLQYLHQLIKMIKQSLNHNFDSLLVLSRDLSSDLCGYYYCYVNGLPTTRPVLRCGVPSLHMSM